MQKNNEMILARPFVKWAGGKTQLISQLESLLPAHFHDCTEITYIEPFIGGGSFLYYILQTHSNIKKAIINDINPKLTTCYKTVRDTPKELIAALENIQGEYLSLNYEEERKAYFLKKRDEFNTTQQPVVQSALFIFLNKTCFNGLYRVNSKGFFNVPFGRYTNPKICDAETIIADSQLLQKVEILTGEFEQTFDYATDNTFFYFDPPYRPLSSTSSFNDYAQQPFNDEAQIRLKKFCDKIDKAGHTFMLSNSDCLAKDGTDRFFDDLYTDYYIERVWAKRSVNAVASKRGKLTEILVHNYPITKVTKQ